MDSCGLSSARRIVTPNKALQLVHRYSELQWAIRACQGYIAEALDKCTGLDGKRLERRKSWESYSDHPIDAMNSETNEKQTHLHEWYEAGYDYEGERFWNKIGDSEAQECIHCYAAHCQIQKRKALRRQFGSVKAAMTRTTPKPKILDWQPPQREEW